MVNRPGVLTAQLTRHDDQPATPLPPPTTNEPNSVVQHLRPFGCIRRAGTGAAAPWLMNLGRHIKLDKSASYGINCCAARRVFGQR
jgi:hypothetical protein